MALEGTVSSPPEKPAFNHQRPSETTSDYLAKVADGEKSTGTSQDNTEITENPDEAPTPEMLQAVRNWAISRGYHKFVDGPTGTAGGIPNNHPYDAYSDNEVEVIAESGDAAAMTIFADRIMFEGSDYPIERALELHKEAVALGATASAVNLGVYLASPDERITDGKSGEETLAEGLAWLTYAAENGDPNGQIVWGRYSKSFREDGTLLDRVCSEYESISNEIEGRRLVLGLDYVLQEPHPFASQIDRQYGSVPRGLCSTAE